MAYFSNGSENEGYVSTYCDRCIHLKDEGCPIMDIHWLYQSEQKDICERLIPREKDGVFNDKCKFFIDSLTVPELPEDCKDIDLSIPLRWIFKVLERGAGKGSITNNANFHYNRALLHLQKYFNGDTSEPHIAHAITRLVIGINRERKP